MQEKAAVATVMKAAAAAVAAERAEARGAAEVRKAEERVATATWRRNGGERR